jgi:hypothetical protein
MQAELAPNWQEGPFTALLVTHDVEEALFLARQAIVLSDHLARIKAEILNGLPYPCHRGDPHLAELRHRVLTLLGLDAIWRAATARAGAVNTLFELTSAPGDNSIAVHLKGWHPPSASAGQPSAAEIPRGRRCAGRRLP